MKVKTSRATKAFIGAMLLFLALAVKANGQTVVTASPQPRWQFLSATGAPLAGGKLFTYQAGTSTPLATYTDSTGTAQNANPIVLDSTGSASIWLQQQGYKFVLDDASGNLIWTADNVLPSCSVGHTCVLGPGSSTNGDMVCWSGTTGGSQIDCGPPVGPYATGDAVQFVSASGSNSNTGLDPGHARLGDATGFAAAYAALPASGGTIKVSGSNTVTSALAFGIAQKPVMIECNKGASLTFSAITGAQITLNWGFSTPANQTVQGGISGCIINVSGTAAAIELGGTNGGADGARVIDNTFLGSGATATGIQLTTGTLGPFNIVIDHNYFNGFATDVALGGPGCEDVDFLNGVLGNANTGLSVTAGCDVRLAGVEFDANNTWAIDVGATADVHLQLVGVHFENPGGAPVHYIRAAGGQNQEIDISSSTFANDTTSGTATDHMISLTGTTAATTLAISDSNIGSCGQVINSFIDAADNNDILFLKNNQITCSNVTQLYPPTGPTVVSLQASYLLVHPPGFSLSTKYGEDASGNAQITNGSFGLSMNMAGLTANRTETVPDRDWTAASTIASGTVAMPTSAVGAGTCVAAAGNPVSATGALTTDVVSWSYNAAPAANPGQLTIAAWPTAGGVNFEYCNPSAGSITPTAATLNWRVSR